LITCVDALNVQVLLSPFSYRQSKFYLLTKPCALVESLTSLVTNDMVSILKGNYGGEVGLFVCHTKAKVLVNLYDRIGVKSI